MADPGIAPTYSWTPPASQQFATALVDAPEAAAERQQKVATAQAGTAEADVAKSAANDKMLATLLKGAQASPQFAQSPMFQKAVANRLGQMGLPVPKDQTGGLDMNALQHYASPLGKHFSELTPQEQETYLAMPPDVRKVAMAQIQDVPPEFLGGRRYIKLAPGSETAVLKGFDDAAHRLSMRQMTPEMFARYVADNRDNLEAVGKNPDEYLNPDGSLSDTLKNQVASDYATAQIEKMDRLGIAAVDRSKLLGQIQAERIREFDAKQGEHVREFGITSARADKRLTLAERREQTQEATAISQSAKRTADIQQGWQRLTISQQNANTSGNRLVQAAANQHLQSFQRMYQDAVNQRDANLRSIQNAVTNHAPLNQELVDKTDELNGVINEIGPQLGAMQAQFTGQPAQHYQTVSGNAATTIKSTPGVPNADAAGAEKPMTSVSKSGKPIYSKDGGKTWQYGTP